MEYRIGLIHGDGIGPEIVDEAKKVLDAVCEKYGHQFEYTNLLLGGASIDVHGVPLTDEAIATAKASDAVLIVTELYDHVFFCHVDDDTVEAACSYNTVTYSHIAEHSLYSLLLFLLRSDHQKIHNTEKYNQPYDGKSHTHSA